MDIKSIMKKVVESSAEVERQKEAERIALAHKIKRHKPLAVVMDEMVTKRQNDLMGNTKDYNTAVTEWNKCMSVLETRLPKDVLDEIKEQDLFQALDAVKNIADADQDVLEAFVCSWRAIRRWR